MHWQANNEAATKARQSCCNKVLCLWLLGLDFDDIINNIINNGDAVGLVLFGCKWPPDVIPCCSDANSALCNCCSQISTLFRVRFSKSTIHFGLTVGDSRRRSPTKSWCAYN
jgi:hypothetical protein